MIPGKYNMVCPQGTTFNLQLVYSVDEVPVDLFGYSARMQVREKYTSTSKTLDLNTENGGISLIAEEGAIRIFVSDSQTSAMPAKEYVYDMEIVSSSNNVTRILEGKFLVTPEVTR